MLALIVVAAAAVDIVLGVGGGSIDCSCVVVNVGCDIAGAVVVDVVLCC